MSQTYNDNTKRLKPKGNQLGILGISSRKFMYSFGNSAESLGSGRECCWGYVSIFENTIKSCCISPLKVASTLIREKHSWNIVVT